MKCWLPARFPYVFTHFTPLSLQMFSTGSVAGKPVPPRLSLVVFAPPFLPTIQSIILTLFSIGKFPTVCRREFDSTPTQATLFFFFLQTGFSAAHLCLFPPPQLFFPPLGRLDVPPFSPSFTIVGDARQDALFPLLMCFSRLVPNFCGHSFVLFIPRAVLRRLLFAPAPNLILYFAGPVAAMFPPFPPMVRIFHCRVRRRDFPSSHLLDPAPVCFFPFVACPFRCSSWTNWFLFLIFCAPSVEQLSFFE